MSKEFWHMKQVAVLGEGAWGSAMATLLAHNGLEVTLWCHDPAVAEIIKRDRRNPTYLPDIVFDKRIIPTTDLAKALAHHTIFEALPVAFLRNVLMQGKRYVPTPQCWVLLSKGVESGTLYLPSQILADVIPEAKSVVLTGPSYAYDLARQQPTAVVLASTEQKLAQKIQSMVENNFFATSLSKDVVGSQWCAAIKNVVALGIGILEGAGYPDNTLIWALTRGFQEMSALVLKMDGQEETIHGLAGFGDLTLTCLGKHSRNRQLGKEIGKQLSEGQSKNNSLRPLPEGMNTIISVQTLMINNGLYAPFLQALHDVIIQGAPSESLIIALKNSQ
jgi:glycerol-3-phosphate dehydrogenase (NAD(P)+)